MESILQSTKQILGITSDFTAFDAELIIHINMALNVLYQLGVGEYPVVIHDANDTWADFLYEQYDLEMVKTYVAMKVKKVFDPPTGSGMNSLDSVISELEFRILVQADPYEGGTSKWNGCK